MAPGSDMQPAQEIYALFLDRVRERFDWIERRLQRMRLKVRWIEPPRL